MSGLNVMSVYYALRSYTGSDSRVSINDAVLSPYLRLLIVLRGAQRTRRHVYDAKFLLVTGDRPHSLSINLSGAPFEERSAYHALVAK